MKIPKIPKVVAAEEITTDFDNWNEFQNKYGLKTIGRNIKFPKWLLIQTWREFENFCFEYHIEVTKYKFCEITKFDSRWQIDFYDREDMKGARITISAILYCSKRKQIFERVISI